MHEQGTVKPVFQAPKLKVKVPKPKQRLGNWGYGFAFLASLAFSLALLVTLNLKYGFMALGVHASISLAVVNLAICVVLSAGLIINAMVARADAIQEMLSTKSKGLSFWLVLSALALCVSAVFSIVGFDLFLQSANMVPAFGLLAAVGLGIVFIRFAVLPVLHGVASRQMLGVHPAITGFIDGLNNVCSSEHVTVAQLQRMQSFLLQAHQNIMINFGMTIEAYALALYDATSSLISNEYYFNNGKQAELAGISGNHAVSPTRRIWFLLYSDARWAMPSVQSLPTVPAKFTLTDDDLGTTVSASHPVVSGFMDDLNEACRDESCTEGDLQAMRLLLVRVIEKAIPQPNDNRSEYARLIAINLGTWISVTYGQNNAMRDEHQVVVNDLTIPRPKLIWILLKNHATWSKGHPSVLASLSTPAAVVQTPGGSSLGLGGTRSALPTV